MEPFFDMMVMDSSSAGWHLELTYDPANPLPPSPTVDDLLVIYLGGPVPDTLVERLIETGGK